MTDRGSLAPVVRALADFGIGQLTESTTDYRPELAALHIASRMPAGPLRGVHETYQLLVD